MKKVWDVTHATTDATGEGGILEYLFPMGLVHGPDVCDTEEEALERAMRYCVHKEDALRAEAQRVSLLWDKYAARLAQLK